MQLITRKEYHNGECTFSEYYRQFVDETSKNLVINLQLEGENRTKLLDWTRLVPFLSKSTKQKMRDAGDYLTDAGGVCILKEAKRMLDNE